MIPTTVLGVQFETNKESKIMKRESKSETNTCHFNGGGSVTIKVSAAHGEVVTKSAGRGGCIVKLKHAELQYPVAASASKRGSAHLSYTTTFKEPKISKVIKDVPKSEQSISFRVTEQLQYQTIHIATLHKADQKKFIQDFIKFALNFWNEAKSNRKQIKDYDLGKLNTKFLPLLTKLEEYVISKIAKNMGYKTNGEKNEKAKEEVDLSSVIFAVANLVITTMEHENGNDPILQSKRAAPTSIGETVRELQNSQVQISSADFTPDETQLIADILSLADQNSNFNT